MAFLESNRPGGRFALGLLIAILLPGILAPSSAGSAPVMEYRVKAALLYNFAKFVEWPDASGPQSSWVIGVLGVDPFGDALEHTMRDKMVRGKRIEIRRFATPSELEDCHILFVSDSEARSLPEILDHLNGRPILTVSDMERFARQGGMVSIVEENDRLRFRINVDAAEQSSLTISSKMLGLADVVKSSRRRES